MPQGPYLREYGNSATIPFVLFEVDGVDFRVDAAHAAGDTKLMKDEGAEANTSNGFTDEGQGYSIVLTATEMQMARGVVYVVDSATKVWLDDSLLIETYGHASAQHAFNLNDSVRGGMTALPNAAADASGGLPISDGGGLDLDAQIGTDIDALVTRVTAARMSELDPSNLPGDIDAIRADSSEMQGMLPSKSYFCGSDDSDGGLDASELAMINAEMSDVMSVDTQTLPGQEAPSNTPTYGGMLGWLYKLMRNKKINTSSETQLFDDAGTTVDAKQSTTESGANTFVGEMGSGP